MRSFWRAGLAFACYSFFLFLFFCLAVCQNVSTFSLVDVSSPDPLAPHSGGAMVLPPVGIYFSPDLTELYLTVFLLRYLVSKLSICRPAAPSKPLPSPPSALPSSLPRCCFFCPFASYSREATALCSCLHCTTVASQGSWGKRRGSKTPSKPVWPPQTHVLIAPGIPCPPGQDMLPLLSELFMLRSSRSRGHWKSCSSGWSSATVQACSSRVVPRAAKVLGQVDSCVLVQEVS